jgi:hypothetical protein
MTGTVLQFTGSFHWEECWAPRATGYVGHLSGDVGHLSGDVGHQPVLHSFG